MDLKRAVNRKQKEPPARRVTFVAPGEIACATAAIELFSSEARPKVVALRRRSGWIPHPAEVCTRDLLAQLRAGGVREVQVRWRLRTRRLAVAEARPAGG